MRGFERLRCVIGILALCIPILISGCPSAVNKVPVTYSDRIQNLPGGAEIFWPNKNLKKAFTEYWNLRYSENWETCYEKEAPYFQEIVSRSRYEAIVKTTRSNSIIKVEVHNIQKVTSNYYEIQVALHVVRSNKEKKVLSFVDRWVYAGSGWYHILRDKFIFSEAS